MSSMRARCPNCRTFTAVAIGDGYECHSCGSTFAAGMVRVPAAWGSGGEAMAEGARIALPYPEVAVVERDTLEEQTAAVADALAARPIVVGGCCCTHVGGVRGVSQRVDRLGIVWIDAHGDLNTPETSPSGNQWGMPFRMILDAGFVRPEDAALVGARSLDPPEAEFLAATGSTTLSIAHWQKSTLSTSRWISTCSIRARSMFSSPSRTARRPTRSKDFSEASPREPRLRASASQASSRPTAMLRSPRECSPLLGSETRH